MDDKSQMTDYEAKARELDQVLFTASRYRLTFEGIHVIAAALREAEERGYRRAVQEKAAEIERLQKQANAYWSEVETARCERDHCLEQIRAFSPPRREEGER